MDSPKTIDPAARRSALAELAALPARARAAVRGLTPAQLDTPYRVGGWNSRQVLHHLADSHMNAFVRMKLVLCEEHPTLKPYDENAWAKTPDSASAPVESSLQILEGLHARMVALLETQPAAAFARSAHHPERGTVTLGSLLALYAGHGAHHLEFVEGLRRARGW